MFFQHYFSPTRDFLHILKHFKMLMRQRLSNFAFLRIDGVVRSVELESLFVVFSVLCIRGFLLAPLFFFRTQNRERERVCVLARSETNFRPIHLVFFLWKKRARKFFEFEGRMGLTEANSGSPSGARPSLGLLLVLEEPYRS